MENGLLHLLILMVKTSNSKLLYSRGITRPNMTQQVGRAQHGLLIMDPYIYIDSIFLVAGHSEHLAGPMPCCRYTSVVQWMNF